MKITYIRRRREGGEGKGGLRKPLLPRCNWMLIELVTKSVDWGQARRRTLPPEGAVVVDGTSRAGNTPGFQLAGILDIHQIIPFVKLSKQAPRSRRHKIDLDLCWQTFDLPRDSDGSPVCGVLAAALCALAMPS